MLDLITPVVFSRLMSGAFDGGTYCRIEVKETERGYLLRVRPSLLPTLTFSNTIPWTLLPIGLVLFGETPETWLFVLGMLTVLVWPMLTLMCAGRDASPLLKGVRQTFILRRRDRDHPKPELEVDGVLIPGEDLRGLVMNVPMNEDSEWHSVGMCVVTKNCAYELAESHSFKEALALMSLLSSTLGLRIQHREVSKSGTLAIVSFLLHLLGAIAWLILGTQGFPFDDRPRLAAAVASWLAVQGLGTWLAYRAERAVLRRATTKTAYDLGVDRPVAA